MVVAEVPRRVVPVRQWHVRREVLVGLVRDHLRVVRLSHARASRRAPAWSRHRLRPCSNATARTGSRPRTAVRSALARAGTQWRRQSSRSRVDESLGAETSWLLVQKIVKWNPIRWIEFPFLSVLQERQTKLALLWRVLDNAHTVEDSKYAKDGVMRDHRCDGPQRCAIVLRQCRERACESMRPAVRILLRAVHRRLCVVRGVHDEAFALFAD